jgi:hypothetical protein
MTDIQKINEIDWSSYQYGEDTSKYLIDLFSNNREKINLAIGKLEDMLCHQHVWVLPALAPAFPFLVEALQTLTDVKNLGPLLEFFWGISRATYPIDRFYSIRALDLSWTSIPDKPSVPTEDYVREIRWLLLLNRKLFSPFLRHEDDGIFECAAVIAANSVETSVEASQDLRNALVEEDNPRRRYHLFYGLRELFFEKKTDYLIQAFRKEIDKAVKSEIAGQIAYQMKTNSPPDVIEFLSKLVLGLPESEIGTQNEYFFMDMGIPLALAQPDKYEDILERFIRCMKQKRFGDNVAELLAFTFCWQGKPDFNHLNALQLSAIEAVYQKTWQGHIIHTSHDFHYFSLPTDPDEIRTLFLKRKT